MDKGLTYAKTSLCTGLTWPLRINGQLRCNTTG